MYYTQEQIDRANQADLVSFLQSQGEQLTRAGNEYRWKRHDSLTVRGNKWYRHSQSKGGGPVDFVMEFFGKSFTEAVELLTGEKGETPPPEVSRRSLAVGVARYSVLVPPHKYGVVVGCVLVNIAAGKEKARHIFINAAGCCEVVPRYSVVVVWGR